jgi:glyoxylase-like metal-dependent hydrolase (beta-lactamase superfamily II)
VARAAGDRPASHRKERDVVNHVTEVAEGIHRLTNGVANFYLIEESGKLVLVDAGAPKDWALFTQAALDLGKVAGDLDAVLLTHAHTDHTGFAEEARATRTSLPDSSIR